MKYMLLIYNEPDAAPAAGSPEAAQQHHVVGALGVHGAIGRCVDDHGIDRGETELGGVEQVRRLRSRKRSAECGN